MTTPVAPLGDVAEIVALRVAFGHALDTRNWAMMDAIFTTEVDADLSALGGPSARMSRTDFVALFRHSFRHDHVRTFQAYTNFQVKVDGEAARMISLLHGHHAGDGFEGGSTFDLRARYLDGLRRTTEGWRIESVTLEVVTVSGNTALVA